MNKPRTLVRELVPVVLLVLATMGFFWRILFSPGVWKPAGGGDLVSFLYPIYRFAAASLRSGVLPLWNPHLYGGAPFLADMQTGLFYPLNILLFLLAPDFSYQSMEAMSIVHVFLAGLFMYLCLRYLEPDRPLRVPAALVGALAYMFSDMFVVHFGNLNLIAVAAWLPLIVLLFWRSLRTRRLLYAVGAGLILGISTLEGHLQITLFIGLALAVTALGDSVDRWQGHSAAPNRARPWRGLAWPWLALLVTAVLGIALSALVLLPAFEYATLSPRAELTYREAARYSLVPALLGELLVPSLFASREPSLYWGVWDRVAVGYLGILPLVLAAMALLMRSGRRRERRLFGLLAAVALLLALGGESVFHGWVYRLLPGFDQIRAPARFVLLLDFGLAGLAAIGLDTLLRPLDRGNRRLVRQVWRGLIWGGGAAAIVGCAWAYLVIYWAQDRDPGLFWRVSGAGSGVIFALLMLGASLTWLGARSHGRLRRQALGWLAAGLVFVDLATVGAYVDLGHTDPAAGFDHPQIVDFFQGKAGVYRIDSRTDVWGEWQPNLALIAGLYDVSGVDNPLVVADVARYWEGTGGRSTALYDFLGVRYVLGSKDVTLDWNKFSLAFDGDPAVNVYRNSTALPRAFVVFRAQEVDDHEEAWTQIHQQGFDPTHEVVLEGGKNLNGAPEGQAVASIVVYGSNQILIDVDSPAEGYLVLSDPFYPGWKAALDDQPVPILRANYAFRAVAVPAGTSRVTMTFRPWTWTAGLVVSLLTVLVLFAGFGVWWRTRRRVES